VPVIQRCNLGEPQALGDGYHGGIDDAKREIYITLYELAHALDVLVFQSSDVKAVVAERFQEGDFRLRSHPGLKQVADLTQHRRWHQQRSFGLAQQPQTRLVGLVFDIACGQEHPSVTQQHVSGRVRR